MGQWEQRREEKWRGFIGRYGISGKLQTSKVKNMFGQSNCSSHPFPCPPPPHLAPLFPTPQRSRIVFAMICLRNPNLLLLDEPTNHLDIEAIDSLAEAIKKFNGGMVLVSHDFRLIDQVRLIGGRAGLLLVLRDSSWVDLMRLGRGV